jgi:hypothetical protein
VECNPDGMCAEDIPEASVEADKEVPNSKEPDSSKDSAKSGQVLHSMKLSLLTFSSLNCD